MTVSTVLVAPNTSTASATSPAPVAMPASTIQDFPGSTDATAFTAPVSLVISSASSDSSLASAAHGMVPAVHSLVSAEVPIYPPTRLGFSTDFYRPLQTRGSHISPHKSCGSPQTSTGHYRPEVPIYPHTGLVVLHRLPPAITDEIGCPIRDIQCSPTSLATTLQVLTTDPAMMYVHHEVALRCHID